MNKQEAVVNIAGKDIRFETGKVARQANGAVIVRSGETLVLATACSTKDPLPDIDFLPLRVDYQEKFSSAGKTPAGFIKREGKPSERETLVSRLIDRPIRPMFPDGYYHDVQILSYVMSYDNVHSPDVLAICAASAALAISDIPLVKPIGAVRVGMIGEQCIINPTVEEQKSSILDLVIAGTEDAVLMIEGSCQFLTEEQVLHAIDTGHKAIKDICSAITQLQLKAGKHKKTDTIKVLAPYVIQAVRETIEKDLHTAIRIREKAARGEALSNLYKKAKEHLCVLRPDGTKAFEEKDIAQACNKLESDAMRTMILEEKVRCDGRALDEIRPIFIEQSFLPRTHGSSLFTRGETQTIAVCILGGENMGQRYETLDGEGTQRFYLQYFFPPFSVGEVGRVGAPGRREVGHGKLAERALLAIVPNKQEFPYTIRLESNITESNGSSSMASVCGGCLALMDAGVPVSRPVSGIAMGLILEGNKSAILSDILGIEDALGDMDFKVTGDDRGITAFQMDIKVEGITINIMKQALEQAKRGRIHILNKMLEVCPKAREQMSVWAPKIEIIKVKPSKIGMVIGPGGKQIRAIIEQTGAQIDINDEGIVSISATSQQAVANAKNFILGLVAEAEIGHTYNGVVTSIVDFGVFVEILPGKEGLCHISELDGQRIENLRDYITQNNIKIGGPLTVTVIDINDRGQVKLSRKSQTPRQPRSQQR